MSFNTTVQSKKSYANYTRYIIQIKCMKVKNVQFYRHLCFNNNNNNDNN